jgi:hypothetical protein
MSSRTAASSGRNCRCLVRLTCGPQLDGPRQREARERPATTRLDQREDRGRIDDHGDVEVGAADVPLQHDPLGQQPDARQFVHVVVEHGDRDRDSRIRLAEIDPHGNPLASADRSTLWRDAVCRAVSHAPGGGTGRNRHPDRRVKSAVASGL